MQILSPMFELATVRYSLLYLIPKSATILCVPVVMDSVADVDIGPNITGPNAHQLQYPYK